MSPVALVGRLWGRGPGSGRLGSRPGSSGLGSRLGRSRFLARLDPFLRLLQGPVRHADRDDLPLHLLVWSILRSRLARFVGAGALTTVVLGVCGRAARVLHGGYARISQEKRNNTPKPKEQQRQQHKKLSPKESGAFWLQGAKRARPWLGG